MGGLGTNGPRPTGRWPANRALIALIVAIVVIASASVCPAGHAQPFDQTPVTVTFKEDGTIEARVTFDVDALLADIPFRELTEEDYQKLREMPAEQRAERLDTIAEYLRIRVLLKFDGKPIETEVVFPERGKSEARGESPLPGKYFVVRGKVPGGAEEFRFTASPIFFRIFLMIRVENEEKGRREVLMPGAESRPFTEFPRPISSKSEQDSDQGT